MNKYEMVLISAREARRLNEGAKMAGRELKIRPTEIAWDRMQAGKVKFTYEEEIIETEEEVVEVKEST
jgi:DNA-directed RNA polymerase omega subunit